MKKIRFGLVAVAVSASAVVGTASVAGAGEMTGNGEYKEVNGHSECAYSGQNDEYHQGDPNASRTQSYGHYRSSGAEWADRGIPGYACNPTHNRQG